MRAPPLVLARAPAPPAPSRVPACAAPDRASARPAPTGLRARRVIVPAALALLSACGEGTRKQAAPADTARPVGPPPEARACSLIRTAELERITGAQLAPGPRTEDYQGYSRCDWTRGGTGFLALVVNERGDFYTYISVPGAQPFSGIGRDAVWNPRTQQLAVQLDTGTVSVNFLSGPFERKWADEIARAVVARLKDKGAAPATTP